MSKRMYYKKIYVKDFMFYKYEMYILADLKWNCKKPRFLKKQRRLLKRNLNQKKSCILK